VIEKLQKVDGFTTDALSFRSRGMNIYLETIAAPGAKKCVRLRVGGVGAAVLITESITENWTISIQAESSQGVGVLSEGGASICVGPAQNAIESDTTASHR
jgi:hypothetical protein